MVISGLFSKEKKRIWNVFKTFKNAQNDVSAADLFFDKTHI